MPHWDIDRPPFLADAQLCNSRVWWRRRRRINRSSREDLPAGSVAGKVHRHTPPPTTLRGLAAAKSRSFGVSVDATFFGTSPAAYDTVVAHEFNMIVAGNVMKWSSIHRDSRYAYRWTNPDTMVAFAQANTMKVRGHTLAWYQQNPAWLTNTTWNPETLKVVLKEHIDSVVGHYKGKGRRLGCRQRSDQRRQRDASYDRLAMGDDDRRVIHRSRVQGSARRRSRRAVLLQRLQHRVPRRETGFRIRDDQRDEVARRADRRDRIPSALPGQCGRQRCSVEGRARRHLQSIRRARPQDSHHGARHSRPHARRDHSRALGASARIRERRFGVSRGVGLRGDHRLGAQRRRVVGAGHVPRLRSGAALRRLVRGRRPTRR